MEELSVSSRSESLNLPPPRLGAVVRYDSRCALCSMLADFSQRKMQGVEGVIFAPSQEQNPDQLHVELQVEGVKTTLAGPQAWSWLLAQHPSLRELQWIASKIGLTAQAGRVLHYGTGWLRKFCLRCR